uniref:Vomeronasal type-2 receptor 26-like n=1 Tax=Pogona vitticeps TaxID=103695 RepID=A0ABM5GQ40_9SAUR
MRSNGDLARRLSAILLVFLPLQVLLQHWCSSHRFSSTRCDWQPGTQMPSDNPSEEVVIGGFVSISLANFVLETFMKHPQPLWSTYMIPKNYQHILALAFAIHEINTNDELLPNITLGYKIYDNKFDSWRATQTTLHLLFRVKGNPLNYNCEKTEQVLAVVGGLTSQNSMQMAHILSIYNIPQVSYGSFEEALSDNIQFPFLYRMTPNEEPQYVGIVCLLQYFGWNWVGLIVPDDNNGETFLRTLTPKLFESHICIVWTMMIPRVSVHLPNKLLNQKLEPIMYTFRMIEINVVLVHGDKQSLEGLYFILLYFELFERQPQRRVWVTTAQWDYTSLPAVLKPSSESLNGTLSFALHTNVVPGFQDFLENINPFHSNIYFIPQFWFGVFLCSFPLRGLYYPDANNCTGQEKLTGLPGSVFEMGMTGHSYSVYNAVYFVAHALHAIYSLRAQQKGRRDGDKQDPWNIHPWQLHSVLKTLHFNNNAGEEIFLDEKRELAAGFDINNFFVFPNGSFQKVRVGHVDPLALEGKQFAINGSTIVWNQKFHQKVPRSTCVESCLPGHSMFVQPGKQVCCYDCVECPEGRISTQMDAAQCEQCPGDHYPNKNKDCCIPKGISYLSYGEPLGTLLVSFALLLCGNTFVVMGIFLLYHHTPIVKANNWGITWALLSSLLLCFLSSFLFIGWPGKVTCLLRQMVFGVIFSVSVACVLAKTLTVILAFMASKPGSQMRRWLGNRLALSVIIFPSLIQTAICIVWLATSPPFPESDMHSQSDTITVQCNQGSDLMLYLVLGFMWLLAIISFTVAFFARKLPDSFNEAKLITFSMLVFCSIWVSFVPAYLGTQGKYTVAVEVFSILTSSGGLLGFLFFPKCYIMIFRPELNTREQLLSKRSSSNLGVKNARP